MTSLPSRGSSVARCWMSFRNRCGCDQQVQGLTKEQFVRGMRVMGFAYEDDATYDRVFDSLDLDARGRLQMERVDLGSEFGGQQRAAVPPEERGDRRGDGRVEDLAPSAVRCGDRAAKHILGRSSSVESTVHTSLPLPRLPTPRQRRRPETPSFTGA